jgi:arsenite methyltransferase
MAVMDRFWRLVCAPECSDACQVNCPGCYAMSNEWAERGQITVVTGKAAPRFRWRNVTYLWACWSKSASARMLRRLNPRTWFGRPSTPVKAQSTGCGCHTGETVGGLQFIDVGIRLDGGSTVADPRRTAVRNHYDQHAQTVSGSPDGCCGGGLPADVSCVPEYSPADVEAVPENAIVASLGCGNPFARAGLRAGDVVLDLGSGGGLDAIVAARRVGPEGHVFGLDMSDDMNRLAADNAAKAGVRNVAFLKGDMESIPLPTASVDVIISNCVVNLVPDKTRALQEAFRVLRPGGRLSISDIVTRQPVPAELKADLTAWAACIGGALTGDEYRAHLDAAGFIDIDVDRGREYTARDAELAGVRPILERAGLADALALGFANTAVRAGKPAATTTTSHRTPVPALAEG